MRVRGQEGAQRDRVKRQLDQLSRNSFQGDSRSLSLLFRSTHEKRGGGECVANRRELSDSSVGADRSESKSHGQATKLGDDLVPSGVVGRLVWCCDSYGVQANALTAAHAALPTEGNYHPGDSLTDGGFLVFLNRSLTCA